MSGQSPNGDRPAAFAMQLLFFRGPSVVAAASIGLTSPIRSANSFSLALLRPRECYGRDHVHEAVPVIRQKRCRRHRRPSLRGALATKQSRGRVLRPLDCFAALAMTMELPH